MLLRNIVIFILVIFAGNSYADWNYGVYNWLPATANVSLIGVMCTESSHGQCMAFSSGVMSRTSVPRMERNGKDERAGFNMGIIKDPTTFNSANLAIGKVVVEWTSLDGSAQSKTTEVSSGGTNTYTIYPDGSVKPAR